MLEFWDSVTEAVTRGKVVQAQTLCRSHSALGAYYRRMQSRMGAPKAFSRYCS